MGKTLIYQLLPRLFGNINPNRKPNGDIFENGCGKWDHVSTLFLDQLKQQGYTHVWYTGILRQASTTAYPKQDIAAANANVVKGRAGSPYAICDYYDVCPDYATNPDRRMAEFEALVARTHAAGLKCLIDFVPNHVARSYHSPAAPKGTTDFGSRDNTEVDFHPQNNFYYLPAQQFVAPVTHLDVPYSEIPARVSGNDAFTAAPTLHDWYETVKLNYGKVGSAEHFDPIPDTWHKMLDILRFWAAKGVDGFRTDMAEMVPLLFWRWVIAHTRTDFPQLLFVAEAYNQSLYRPFLEAGFDLLYDKVVFYDTLRDVMQQKQPAKNLSHIWKCTGDIQDKLLLFLENHDEQRLASNFFMGNGKKSVPGVYLSLFYSRSAFMLYSGQELGESGMDEEGFSGTDGRTTLFDYWGIELWQKYVNQYQFNDEKLPLEAIEIRHFYIRMLKLLTQSKALQTGAFYDLMWYNENPQLFPSADVYAFLRFEANERYLIVVNFSECVHQIYLRIPQDAFDAMQIAPDQWITGTDTKTQRLCIQGDAHLANARGWGIKIEPSSGMAIALTPRGT